MSCSIRRPRLHPPRTLAWVLTAGLLAMMGMALSPSLAAALGKIQGKVVATDSGEPIGYADLLLIPADTTMKKVGGLTNADGTFLLQAPAGRYTLQIRALSYARKRVENIVLEDGQLLPFSTTLAPEAIQQQEIVVEATAKKNTEASMLAARKKAGTVGDAVSAEQMRRAPDKNAGDVLRRVTGLSVTEGKYVFVRGMGERYSSTEVDGVRIASPEQNKRVVPMDLFPAALLENIVIQKTYTADRAGEFGGGDVQVRTKDFPGKRLWSFSIEQGVEPGTTFKDRETYTSSSADIFGYGSGSRGIPDAVTQIAGDRPLAEGNGLGFPTATLVAVEKEFANVWTPNGVRTRMNGSYSVTFGDQYQVFGRPLGFVQAWSLSRSFNQRDEVQRSYTNLSGDLQYDYLTHRSTESVQLGGNGGVSYRLSPGQQLHARGFYSNSADDEVRQYEGLDAYSDPIYRRSTRLMYIQRSVLSGALEGQHNLPRLLGVDLDWKLTRASARRQQPDRRENMYIRVPIDETNPGYWGLAVGRREYGDLTDDGWGTSVKGSLPYRAGSLGTGKVSVGYDRQTKERENFYRRFDFSPILPGQDALPESLYDKVSEATLSVDNYRANQKVEALFISTDLPLGKHLRGNLGVRRELGIQDVVSHDLFDPTRVTSEGNLENTDWLGGANLAWSITEAINLRAAASRTLSRPDLDELSPSPSLDVVGDYQRLGNPNLQRATIENYDLRLEAFPATTEVFAIGAFLKNLHGPIEYTVRGASGGNILIPDNSANGHNLGMELEARANLGRVFSRLRRMSLNSNFSVISSEVELKDSPTKKGSQKHPLQGQANYLANAALSYLAGNGGLEASVLVSATGKRLVLLSNANEGRPDIYDPGIVTLDASVSFAPFHGARLKFNAGNLLDRRVQELFGTLETRGYTNGRTFSLAFSYGS